MAAGKVKRWCSGPPSRAFLFSVSNVFLDRDGSTWAGWKKQAQNFPCCGMAGVYDLGEAK